MKFTTTAITLATASSTIAAPIGCLEARDGAIVNAAVNTEGLIDSVPLLGPTLASILGSLNLGTLPLVGGVIGSLTNDLFDRSEESC